MMTAPAPRPHAPPPYLLCQLAPFTPYAQTSALSSLYCIGFGFVWAGIFNPCPCLPPTSSPNKRPLKAFFVSHVTPLP